MFEFMKFNPMNNELVYIKYSAQRLEYIIDYTWDMIRLVRLSPLGPKLDKTLRLAQTDAVFPCGSLESL